MRIIVPILFISINTHSQIIETGIIDTVIYGITEHSEWSKTYTGRIKPLPNKRNNFWTKQACFALTAGNSGFFHRRAEIRKDDFRRYANVHPNADPQFADPKKSFKNKYASYPDDLSPAFPLSTTLLVGLTDGFHMDNTISIISMSASVGFSMSLYTKPNFKQILIQCLVTWASYGAGRWAADKIYPKVD